jgi:acetyl-CoA carboxylase carboxyl transferase subunit beta
VEKLANYQEKTKMREAVTAESAKLNNMDAAIVVIDFRFLGAGMGGVVGEKLPEPLNLVHKKICR